MAYSFTTTPTATVKAKSATSIDIYTIKGINSSLTSVDDTTSEINKILDIFGKQVVADENTTMTITKESEDNA